MPEKNAWKRGRAAAFRSGCSALSHTYGICCKLVRLEVLLMAMRSAPDCAIIPGVEVR